MAAVSWFGTAAQKQQGRQLTLNTEAVHWCLVMQVCMQIGSS